MDYISVEEARRRSGLRLVLTVGGPGPWSEAAKGFFHVKKLDFVPVAQHAGENDPLLFEWTGQTSAPAAAFDDEPPVSRMADILLLAERLAPEPALVAREPKTRAWVLGLAHEITGRDGLGWSRRLMMLSANLERQREGPPRAQSVYFGKKFGFSPDAAARAGGRVVQVLNLLDELLREQRAAGRRYFVGESLTAIDVLWAAFAAMFAPLPPELCPMHEGLRRMYTATEPEILRALTPALLEHRDWVYREHLRLPLDF